MTEKCKTAARIVCVVVLAELLPKLQHLIPLLSEESSRSLMKPFLCIFDSLSHALLAGAIWREVQLVPLLKPRHIFISLKAELLLSCILSSALDIDHFIAARSLSLFDATHLTSRPFGHSLLFIVISTSLICMLLRSATLTTLYFSAILSHQLRDSLRRGLLVWPFTNTISTPPLHFFLYLSIFVIIPNINAVVIGELHLYFEPIICFAIMIVVMISNDMHNRFLHHDTRCLLYE